MLLFLFPKKLRKINLAVLHCFDANETAIDKQLPADVVRFLFSVKMKKILIEIFGYCIKRLLFLEKCVIINKLDKSITDKNGEYYDKNQYRFG